MRIQDLILLARRVFSVALLVAGLFWSQTAAATPVYTFTFEQTGWMLTSTGTPVVGKLVGSFSGTPDAFGSFVLGSLTDFSLTVAGAGFGASEGANADLTFLSWFGYNIGDNSSFGFKTPLLDGPVELSACSGPAVGFLCSTPGGSTRGVISAVLGFGPDFHTESGAAVTLVATTPIPASLLLFGSALAGLAGLVRSRRRSSIEMAC